MSTARSVRTRTMLAAYLAAGLAAGLAAVVAVAGPVSVLHAQAASLRGTVVTDSSKHPLPNAEVLLSSLDRSTRTDSAGRFEFAGVKAGKHKLVVRLVGYEPINTTLTFDASNTVESEVVLRRTGTQLATVNVRGKLETVREATFEENRKSPGKYLTRELFEQGNGRPLVGLITRNFSGLRVMSSGGKDLIANSRGAASSRDCYVQIIVNGVSLTRSGPFDLNTLNSINVIGVEYYTAATMPAKYNQYDSASACGTIVVWTKD